MCSLRRARVVVGGVAVAALAGGVGGVGGVGGAGQPGDAAREELDRRLKADVEPLVAAYCVSCHSGEKPKGDVRLDRLGSVAEVSAGVDLRLLHEMASGTAMPPKGKPQPTEHERLILAQWAEDAARYVPADAPIDPGWFTIHRLNRSEYRMTLRDLLGIDPAAVDVAAKLPADDTGYGFDNIADVLSTSALSVEQYLDAAERAVELALGPVVEVGDHPRRLGPLEGTTGQALPRGGYFLFSNGGAGAEFEAPAAAEYLVRVSAWETRAGEEHAGLLLRVGKEKAAEFSVKGTRGDPQELTARVRLPRGRVRVSAHFTNDYYVKDKADRNLGVESITIAGPLAEATTDRPPAWSRIFGAGAGPADETDRARSVLRAFAGRAYRRPATEAQVDGLVGVYRAERAAGRAYEPAVRTALSAALVSPNFLFRWVARPPGAPTDARYTLDAYELASRLSYFLWSSMPDDDLLRAAGDGSLLRDEVLAGQVARMLADGRSSALVENFAGQWLQLRALPGAAVDPERFPGFDAALRRDMAAEAAAYFADVLRSGRSVLEFIDARETFLNGRLARFYGVPGVSGNELRRVRLPDGSPRGGVLTMGAVLTLTSHGTRTSPVKRGLFVLDQILGAPPPPPPADVPPLDQAKVAGEGATVRERLAAHVADATCAACHTRLDPLGLAFEHFDAVGRWRDVEGGRPVDATGTLPGGQRLDGTGDLKKVLLGRSDQFVEALAAKLMTYALGRGVEPFDRPAVKRVAARVRARGDRLDAMVESIVLSETFRTCRGRSVSP